MSTINPFTAPACKISRLKDTRMHLQTIHVFSSPITSIFNAMFFYEIPFTWQCKKEAKKGYRFQILHFYEWCSNGITAVKELTLCNMTSFST